MSGAPSHFTSVESSGGVLVLAVNSHQLRDIAAVARFESELRSLPQQHKEVVWLLDFGGTTFFVTPAANTLVAIMRGLRQRGGDLVLTGISQDVRYVLRLLRLDNIFAIYPSAPKALQELGGNGHNLPGKAAEAG
ncbi:MAG: STAS domain-containing protein [Planctomycetota bacterium]